MYSHRFAGPGRAAPRAAVPAVDRFPALALALALVLSATVLAAPGVLRALAPASMPCASAPQADAAAAAAAAQRCGQRVEVAAMRSETGQVFANPSGTLTLVASAVPQRVRLAGGSWAGISTALRQQPGGWWTPEATAARLRLSDGGSGPLASLSTAGGAMALSWPTSLPRPAVDGDTATYHGVLPGTDLRVRATAGGFATVLVVADRAAAANPALRHLRYGLETGGLTLRPRAGGGLDLVDAGASVVGGVEPAAMWDASAGGGPGGPAGARQAGVQVELDGRDLVVSPDPGLLQDPGLTYPLYIDPSFFAGASPWFYADSSNSNRADGIARVGPNPDGSGIYRSFFAFDTRALAGTHVSSATFRSTLIHSWACGSTTVDLYRTDNQGAANGGRVGWAGPALRDWVNEQSGHAHKPSGGAGCGNDPQPDVVLSFGGALGGIVQAHASSGDATMTFALSTQRSDGSAEGTTSLWKKFSPGSTSLTVDFDSFPRLPTGLASRPSGPCTSGAARPALNTSSGVALAAFLSDPDGGNLAGRFWWKRLGDPDPGSALPVTPFQASGTRFTTAAGIPAGSLLDGQSYAWRVQGDDGTVAGGLSPWCEFTADVTAPAGPPVVQTTELAAFPQPAPATAMVGRPAAVTFTPASGDADVAGYWYGVGPGTPQLSQFAAAGVDGVATALVTPPASGQVLTLAVQEADRAGNRSTATASLRFFANPAAGWWPTTATGAAGLPDASGQGHDLALRGGASVGFGVATLPAPSASADASSPVIADTTQSYTVAAWVRLTAAGSTQTAISQDGTQTSAFRLRYRADANAWCMTVSGADASPATAEEACAATPPAVGVWTHLAGVYDAAAGQVRLFVNGSAAGSAAAPQAWRSAGALAVGRALDAGAASDHLVGDLADVRAWQAALDPAGIGSLAVAPPAAARWGFDDATANSAADLSGVVPGHALTATPAGAVIGSGGHTAGGLVLDGVSGGAAAAGPVIRTDQSFTVTAWVSLTDKSDFRTVAEQDGAHMGGFFLQYNLGVDRWVMLMPTSDSATAPQNLAQSAASPTLGQWTHLAGVYDAGSHELLLYVNGVLADTTTGVTAWSATGTFHVGSAGSSNHVPGAVDDVRVYQGVLSAAQVGALAAS
jgi:hypothetical protein